MLALPCAVPWRKVLKVWPEEDGDLMAGRRSGTIKGAKPGGRGERVEPSKPNHEVPATSHPTVEVGHSPIPSAEASPPQAMNPLWKTRLCNFFDSKSGCRHGRLCTFAHGPEELRDAPDFTRTSICPELLHTGRCRQAAACQYAHSRSELRSMPGLLKTRMCDFHKTGTCMAGDLCRFAHEVAELSDAATAWVSTSARDPCDLDEEELGTVASQDVALQILKELEVRVRAAQISQLEESGRPGPGTTQPSSSSVPSGHSDPWRQRQQMLSQEYVMIEESRVMLQRWNSLQPEARAELLSQLRHLPQLRGEDAGRVRHLGNEAEELPYPRFLRQDQTPSALEPRAGSSVPSVPRHGGVEVEEMARLWRTMQSQQENVSSVPVQATDPQGESEQLALRLKTMTEFFAGHLRNEPR